MLSIASASRKPTFRSAPVAHTSIQCGDARERHRFSIAADGRTTCDCGEPAFADATALVAKLTADPTTPIDVRGCVGLTALVIGAGRLVGQALGSRRPNWGSWAALVIRYEMNPVWRAALDLAQRTLEPQRPAIRELMLDSLATCGYRHALGKRRFREEFHAVWDAPVSELDRCLVSAFDDDPWIVPYAAGWKDEIADKGMAVIDGKFVCGRSTEDPSVVYAIARHEHDGAHWVVPHRLTGKRLTEIGR